MPKKSTKTNRRNSRATGPGNRKAVAPVTVEARADSVPAAIMARLNGLGFQQKAGLALVAASLLASTAASAWLGPDPFAGAVGGISMALAQSAYAAILALSAWLIVGRPRGMSYLPWAGIFCASVALWHIAAGVYSNRLRLEANEFIATFRDEPLNVVGLANALEHNPYIEAYMVMRDAHWDLQDRLDRQFDDYASAYDSYVSEGEFLSVGRLRTRYALWQSFYQLKSLEKILESIEGNPLETADLEWTVNLLRVDDQTRDAYARDLGQAVASAHAWRADFIAREKQTLARIGTSLQVVIEAQGHYRFADGRIVFEKPSDAARFAGKEPLGD